MREEKTMNTPPKNAPPHPWVNTNELRRFWAIARQAGVSADGVHAIIEGHYPGRSRLHDLTRLEFIKLMDLFFTAADVSPGSIPSLDEDYGNPYDGQWRKIRWLQRQLQWSDLHLLNYVKKQCGISHVRFLTTYGARAVITGMEAIMEDQDDKSEKRKETRRRRQFGNISKR